MVHVYNTLGTGVRLPSSESLTPSGISRFFFDIYDDIPRPLRTLVAARPYVCPYDKLVGHVPQGASVLDLGCGTGTLLALLAALDRLRMGVGCDISDAPLRAARQAAARIGAGETLTFQASEAFAAAPEGPFDVVAMIDVLHHVPGPARADAIAQAARRTAPGGVFLYKDMTCTPAWRRWAHTLDDLVFTREFVQQVGDGEVEAWARDCGLVLEHGEYIPRLVYGHQLRLFRKPLA